MTFLLNVFSVASALCVVDLSARWLALRCTGTAVKRVVIFYGSTVTTFPLLGTTLSIGWIPVGGYICIDVERFSRLPLAVRLATVLAGPTALIFIAVALLRYDAAIHHFIAAFPQFFFGALHPRTEALLLFSRLEAVFTSSFLALVGVLAAKLSAVSLLPVGSGTGGQCIRELFKRQSQSRWFEVCQTVTALPVLAVFVAWSFAAVLYAFRPPTGNG
jgi:Peptidase family M50